MRPTLPFLAVLAATLALAIGSGDRAASGQAVPGSPVILSVEPPSATPWSYIVISGDNLMSADGSCSVQVGGVSSYVVNCSANEVRAVVPWTAQTGNVVVTADAIDSDPWPITITPRESPQPAGEEIVPGVIEVKLRPGTDIAAVLALEGDPAQAAQRLGEPGDPYMGDWYQVSVLPGSEFAKAISYSGHAQVLYAGPVPTPEAADVPNDPLFPQQWALTKIDAPTAWTISKGDGVKIAIIDAGFATSHPDLSGHMLAGWNCDGTQDVSPLRAHGTWVAGVAAAVTHNAVGVAGVGWNSLILPLRLDSLVSGESCTEAHDLFLVDKATEEGAKVINMSYHYSSPNPVLCDKVRQARDAGLAPVASAGNVPSSTPVDPAACSTVIGVAATNPDDTRAS